MPIRTTARFAATVVVWSCASCGATTAPAAREMAGAPTSSVTVSPTSAADAAAAAPPKAGADCKIEMDESCTTDRQALACHDGRWEEMICRGPSGCAKNAGKDACDQTVAEDKEVCNLDNDFVCSIDTKAMLQCTKNRWRFAQGCFGIRRCVLERNKVTCDNSIASIGDACREEDDYACSPDAKNALVCRGGKFGIASQCNGKKACRVTGDKTAGFNVECDDSIATVGDPCDKEGHYSCSPDAKQIVKCTQRKYVADDKCKRREKCAVKVWVVGCY